MSQNQEVNNLTYVESRILAEMQSMIYQKGSVLRTIKEISNKRKGCIPIKEKAKLQSCRRKAKQYPINFGNIQDDREEEENKDRDKMV